MFGESLYALTIITDVSHIKKSGVSMMRILNTDQNECLHFYCSEDKTFEEIQVMNGQVTPRENEVLKYLLLGLSSKQIAAELKITHNTVNNHRQNLLKKTQTKSTAELVAYGLKMGYVNW